MALVAAATGSDRADEQDGTEARDGAEAQRETAGPRREPGRIGQPRGRPRDPAVRRAPDGRCAVRVVRRHVSALRVDEREVLFALTGADRGRQRLPRRGAVGGPPEREALRLALRRRRQESYAEPGRVAPPSGGTRRSVHDSPRSVERKRRSPTSIQTTPLPAAATRAVFGSGIGDRLALGEETGDGVADAPVAVGVGVASAAPPPHAPRSRTAARTRGLITVESICPCDARGVSGVPMNAYTERTTCRE